MDPFPGWRMICLMVLFPGMLMVWFLFFYARSRCLRKANASLVERERMNSVLLANLPGIAYRCRFNPQWTMEFISDGCRELTGYSSRDLLHDRVLSYADLIHPDDRERVWTVWQDAGKQAIPARLEYRIVTSDGLLKWVLEQGVVLPENDPGDTVIEGLIIDITDRKNAEAEKEKLLDALRTALAEVKTLRGIVPICANCKRIRDDQGFWEQVEMYVSRNTDASFSHSLCPECLKKLYPEFLDPAAGEAARV